MTHRFVGTRRALPRLAPPLLLLLTLVWTGCGRETEVRTVMVERVVEEASRAEDALRPVAFADLPPMVDDGSWESLEEALDRNLRWLSGRPADRRYTYGSRADGTVLRASVGELRGAFAEVRGWLDEGLTSEQFAARIVHRFEVVESVGRARDGGMLITGYYEAEIDASPFRRPGYDVPIYGPPRGLIRADLGQWNDEWSGRRIAGVLRDGRLVPFPDRGALRSDPILRGREIAWAKDEVDLFFLEVQGSGTLRYPDGRRQRIGYAGANGRVYRSIGKLLIDEGAIPRERMSMQSLRRWLAANPEEVQRVLDFNQSVVFFRRLDGPPVGNLGVPVTPGRSVAVDQKLFPPGGLGFLVTDLPAPADDGSTIVEGPLTRFVVAQDTGGAIRGADRADFFWGRGDEPAARAGVMKQPGRLLFFVPKESNPRPAPDAG